MRKRNQISFTVPDELKERMEAAIEKLPGRWDLTKFARVAINEKLERIESNRCPKCGELNSVESRYCSECGQPLTSEAQQKHEEIQKLIEDNIDLFRSIVKERSKKD